MSLQRSFLKEDRLTVMVTASNPFGPSSVESRSYGINTDYLSESISRSYHRSYVSVNISYRFGSLRAFVKKAAASIRNDDVQGGGGNTSKGGTPQGGN